VCIGAADVLSFHIPDDTEAIIRFMPYRRATRKFPWGRADPEAIYNVCLILKIMLQNHVLSKTKRCLQPHLNTYKYNYMFHDSIRVLSSFVLILFIYFSKF
jgi:hypothetical protein